MPSGSSSIAELIGLAGISIDMSEVKRLEAERDAMYTQVIEAQKAVLRELEAPLLPIATGVLVMPLIGGLDEERLCHMKRRSGQGWSSSARAS